MQGFTEKFTIYLHCKKLRMIDPTLIKDKSAQEILTDTLKRRNADISILNALVSASENRSALTTRLEELQQERNARSKELGELKKRGLNDEFEKMRVRLKALSDDVSQVKENTVEADEKYYELLSTVPNLLDDRVPTGIDESANKTVSEVGKIPDFSFEVKPHYEILESKGLVDFERGAKLSGARFYVYNEEIARLERRLLSLMIELQITNGYKERTVPLLVKDEAMFGTGQYPKFAEEYYKLERDHLSLIPTAEVPLTNLYNDEIIPEENLPLYLTAQTACFRREAGSAGRDTRGLVRVHQFMKVELVKFVLPENSNEELEKLTQDAASVLRILEIPHRVLLLSSGDTSFSASITYDIEVWMPGLKRWLEISSCSNFRDFQARRAKIRVKRKESGKNEYLHTLNGSALAAGRLVAALLEYHQTPEGDIDFDAIERKCKKIDSFIKENQN